MAETNLIINGLDLDLNKPQSESTSLQTVTSRELEEYTNKYKAELRTLPEVQQIVNSIEVQNPQSILNFGSDSANSITKISENLLSSIKNVDAEGAGEVLVQLSKIMDKFDINEFEKTKEPGFIEKVLKKVKTSVEAMLQKYEDLGKETDKIYMILKKYENDIVQDTQKLSMLYQANIQYYQDLEKYIVAGEMALEELDNTHIPNFEKNALTDNSGMAEQQVQALKNCRDMLDSRVYDLRLAEGVAIQSLPMIQSMQRGNFDLARTIKSSFIITLPIFRQCLIQAVQLKRQALMAKNVDALRETTNELLVRNAQNTAKQGLQMAEMAGRGAVDIDKLQESFETIVQGIRDTKQKQEENAIMRKDNSKRLEEFKYKALTQKNN